MPPAAASVVAGRILPIGLASTKAEATGDGDRGSLLGGRPLPIGLASTKAEATGDGDRGSLLGAIEAVDVDRMGLVTACAVPDGIPTAALAT